MAAICVRGLPDEAKALLRLRAARNGRSMEAELRHILIGALLAERRAVDRPAPGGYADGPEPDPRP